MNSCGSEGEGKARRSAAMMSSSHSGSYVVTRSILLIFVAETVAPSVLPHGSQCAMASVVAGA